MTLVIDASHYPSDSLFSDCQDILLPQLVAMQTSRLGKHRAFCAKSMKLGTRVHYTKTSKFNYSAKPDYAWAVVAAIFQKWLLSKKPIGIEPSLSILYRFCGA